MIHFLVGKPRNGKSLRAMMYIYEALTVTQRYVVTNMVLDLDVLQQHLIRTGFPQVQVRSRVRMLDDVETKNFWLYREFGVLETPSGYDDSKSASNVDYSPIFNDPRYYEGSVVVDSPQLDLPRLKGTLYVIDEVHTHWRARGWQGTPRHVEFYNSQHGKLNDEVFFITQNTKLVDPNFMRLAQDFMYCRNHRLEKHGRFRGDNKFTGDIYPGPCSNANEPTLNHEEWRLDKALAACYDTSAGVGMPGGGAADGGFRAKGIPLKMVWVGLAVVLVACWFLFGWIIPKITRKYLAPAIGGKTEQSSPLMPSLQPKPIEHEETLVAPVGLPRSLPDSYVFPARDETPEKILYATGYAVKGERYVVVLSNGDTLSGMRTAIKPEDRGPVSRIGSTRVLLRDGTILRVRGPQKIIAPPSVVPSPDTVPRGTQPDDTPPVSPKVEYTEEKQT